jgi:hypothetical protein
MTYPRVYKKVVECATLATAALMLIGPTLRSAQAQIGLPLTLGCVWPFETTPATFNVMYSDSNAIYWTTPYMLLPGSQLEINGWFFKARFLSLDTYNTLGDSISATCDAQFPLDSGSQNPFTKSPCPRQEPDQPSACSTALPSTSSDFPRETSSSGRMSQPPACRKANCRTSPSRSTASS